MIMMETLHCRSFQRYNLAWVEIVRYYVTSSHTAKVLTSHSMRNTKSFHCKSYTTRKCCQEISEESKTRRESRSRSRSMSKCKSYKTEDEELTYQLERDLPKEIVRLKPHLNVDSGFQDLSHAHLESLKTKHGFAMTSMLHKTYLNLRKNKLVQTHKASLEMDNKKSVSMHDAKEPKINPAGTSEHIFQFMNLRRRPKKFRAQGFRFDKSLPDLYTLDKASETLSSKELFYHKMFQKYQNPNPIEVRNLAALFPDPKETFWQVASLFAEAKGEPIPEPVLSQHLRELYWKASLNLPWFTQLSVTTSHPERERAVHSVYLLMCKQLQTFGLLYLDRDGRWVPITSDLVVEMLETLVKYAESTLAGPKGKGVKIILEQVKNKDEPNDLSQPSCYFNKVVEKGSLKTGAQSDLVDGCVFRSVTDQCQIQANLCDDNRFHAERQRLQLPYNLFSTFPEKQVHMRNLRDVDCKSETSQEISFHGLGKDNNPTKTSHKKTRNEVLDETESHSEFTRKPRWLCTVHVGWPHPFTIHAEGVSLPAAQMVAYMAVARKMKVQGLSKPCNSRVCPTVLEHLVLLDTQSHWELALQTSGGQVNVDSFKADAEIFCDASVSGFGSYLLLKETTKVNWLSEAWIEQEPKLQEQLTPKCRPQFFTLLAEMYSLVVSIFSWKHKLRGRRLVCFSDNQTAIGFINSHLTNRIQLETCLDPMDHLMFTLQSTCLNYNVSLKAVWLGREHNSLADLLSKNDVQAFRKAVPGAVIYKTKAKKLRLKQLQSRSVLDQRSTD